MNRQQLRQDFKKFQQRREELWVGRIRKALRSQVKFWIDTYGLKPTNTDHIILDYAPIYNVLLALYIDAGTVWGAKIYSTLPKLPQPKVKARMPIGLSEFLIAAIKAYFDIDLLNDVQDISDTTRKQIILALKRAAEQGLGVDDTIKLMYDLAANPVRARLIARTETVTAANKGGALAAERTGLVLQKTWIAATDNRTRPDHREVNGTTIDGDELFTVGSDKMKQPGDRGEQGRRTSAKNICNCRCCAAWVGKRDSNGKLLRRQG